MNREEALKIRKGDKLIPDPAWNNTSKEKLLLPTEVIDVNYHMRVQEGVGVYVRLSSGREAWMSAGWFTRTAEPSDKARCPHCGQVLYVDPSNVQP